MKSKPLPKDFYLSSDVVSLSKALLGQVIVTELGGRAAGRIVETEAYWGPEDKASHAYNNKRTKRTETMFHEGGIIYIYLCYGIHHLLNIVTGPADLPHAVLIRAIEPLEGTSLMLERRKMTSVKRNLTAGPGLVTQALGLTRAHDGLSLNGPKIWIEKDKTPKATEILSSPRVGVGYAKEYASYPWRFRIENNPWTSPAK